METQSTASASAQEPPRSVIGGANSIGSKAICSCGEGYTCVITRTQGPDAGKTYNCTGDCVCVLGENADGDSKEKLERLKATGGAYCECGEGWSCVITKVGSGAGKPAFECAGDCTCVTTA
ncbi:hypothetical protein JCGZ_12644 [Jatropha curcas]|uniref:Uncharacterized protein n=1 Tax=Jatropha curcas TaxID=180498 RepID=A0A067KDL1_JATCU|nr:uncharacterized protein LOC105637390 isoform X2 [Jatropha curcas]KDP34296.1 hypothetical protein JCGZ_12644 [Jatropha curcas]